jgi:hypothetical protein
VSCIAALHAESKVVTYPLPLQPNEEVVRLSGNPDFYTAVTKLTIKGIVPKIEYWVVTFSVDKLYPGNFFGKDPVKYPEGSIKYKDGAVVVTTW